MADLPLPAGRPWACCAAECLGWLRAQPDDSVDLVFTSPPYENARLYGELGFRLKGQAWVDWCAARFRECLRVCRGLVCWVVGHGRSGCRDWSAAPALLAADLKRGGGCYLRNPALYRRDGIPGSGSNDWLKANYEWALCATRRRGRLPWSDNTACGWPPRQPPGGGCTNRKADGSRADPRQKRGRGNNLGGRNADGTKKRGTAEGAVKRLGRGRCGATVGDVKGSCAYRLDPGRYARPVLANPGNVISGTVGGNQMGSHFAHANEAPFPLWLPEFFVRSFCQPDGVVLDPFCGSGTTLHAALRWGRRAVGVDARESQVELTKRRLAAELGLFALEVSE